MKTFFIVGFLLVSLLSYAQESIFGNYNSSMAGHSLNFGYAHHFGNSQIGGGLKYNLNNNTVNSSIYYKNLDPNGLGQTFGAQLFYNYYIFKQLKYIEPFITLDIQYAYSETSTYLDAAQGATRFGPFHWIENVIGVGFRVPIIDDLYVISKAGFGGMFILGKDEELLKQKAAWEFGGSLQFGIAYMFNGN